MPVISFTLGNITHYTTTHLLTIAHELKLDPHGCALPYTLAGHFYTLRCMTLDGIPPVTIRPFCIMCWKSWRNVPFGYF